eukprot:IDg7842t1
MELMVRGDLELLIALQSRVASDTEAGLIQCLRDFDVAISAAW